ncbi:biopolymer transporter ExbD [bacterium]|nr:biopolymer transporter ExbD [bacterium]
MRRFRSGRERPTLNCKINITNLVDVALTVLIMFIVVAPLIENGVSVKLPEASASKMDFHDTVNIKVAKGGGVYLGEAEKKLGLTELQRKLRPLAAANPKLTVNILADAEVLYQDLVSVLDSVRRAGVVNVGLATEVKVKAKK